MYWNEHEPPHFHAVYGEYGAVVSIETGEVIRGETPAKSLTIDQRMDRIIQTGFIGKLGACPLRTRIVKDSTFGVVLW